jgi:hypothetical protein
MHRGDEYTKRVGIDGLVRTATDENYRNFFRAKYEVRVRFYGDYRDVLTGTPYEYALKSMYEVTEATKQNSRFQLYFGVFADESSRPSRAFPWSIIWPRATVPDRKRSFANITARTCLLSASSSASTNSAPSTCHCFHG